jgi:hypothetical protein
LRLNRENPCNLLIVRGLVIRKHGITNRNTTKKGLAVLSNFRSLKALLALAALSVTALLAGCGGGGAKDPFDQGPPAPALTVAPSVITLYSNIPAVVTVTSGTAPFQVFSSNSTVLPVTAVTSGTLLTLTPNNVNADTEVALTIRDGAGRSTGVTATVKPATLVNAVEIVPLANSACSGSGPTPVCTGDTATVKVTVRSANTSVIPNRQVRFDVVYGAFQFVTDASGANASSTVTLTTDQNGVANALIKTADGVASQAAVIRATDLVTGNRVDTAFTIVQQIAGEDVLSVVPGSYSSKAFFKGECGGTSGDFLVYGGRPPYTARSSLPTRVRLSVNGFIGDPVTIANSGGSFRASTASDACVGYEAAIVVTDSAGRNVTVTYKEEEGSNTPTPPVGLVISPENVRIVCSTGRAVNFLIAGGTPPYVLRTNRPAETSVSGNVVTITAVATLPATTEIDVQVTDAAAVQKTTKITCE